MPSAVMCRARGAPRAIAGRTQPLRPGLNCAATTALRKARAQKAERWNTHKHFRALFPGAPAIRRRETVLRALRPD